MNNMMNTIFMLICFVALSNTIEINLPLSDEDKKKSKTEYFYIDLSCAERMYSITCANECIFGIDGNVINRVSYNGYILFDDTQQQTESFNRVINYSSHDGRTSISIHPEGRHNEYEASFYIANGTVYNLLKAKELITSGSGLIKGRTPGAFLTSMFFKIPELADFKYGYSSLRANSPTVPTDDSEVPIDIIADDINLIFKRKILRKSSLYEEHPGSDTSGSDSDSEPDTDNESISTSICENRHDNA